MGVMYEKSRIYDELETVFKDLTDEEEDAKLTIEIVKQAILRMDTQDDDE
jgi:hypothetical protein